MLARDHLELVVEGTAGRQPGQRVVAGECRDAVPHALLGRDVLFRAEDADRPAMLVANPDEQAHPAILAAGRPDPAIEREALGRCGWRPNAAAPSRDGTAHDRDRGSRRGISARSAADRTGHRRRRSSSGPHWRDCIPRRRARLPPSPCRKAAGRRWPSAGCSRTPPINPPYRPGDATADWVNRSLRGALARAPYSRLSASIGSSRAACRAG